jgi:hypothetical protein
MHESVTCFLVIAAAICTVVAAIGKCPLWIAVLLLALADLLACFPK